MPESLQKTFGYSASGRRRAAHSSIAPDVIGGMSWQSVADSLKQPDSTQARAILGSANLVTAAICKMTGDHPAPVCSSAVIQDLEKNLK